MHPATLDGLIEQLSGTPITEAICAALPKVELHAHLNGSIRSTTVAELAEAAGVDKSLLRDIHDDNRDLAACFRVFSVIHKLVRTAEVLERIAFEVVEDFARENVVYVELRTTPRAVPETGLTEEGYVEAVLAGIRRALRQYADRIDAMLILSVNRTMSLCVPRRVSSFARAHDTSRVLTTHP